MIKLFITDIDGCLADPYEPYDLDGLATLRCSAKDARALREEGPSPALSVCSGRSFPYVEAITQALALTTPVLFEAGGGRYDPVAAQTTWSPQLTDEADAKLNAVEQWFLRECIPGAKLSLDHAKRTQTGVVSPDIEEILALRPKTEQFVAEEAPGLHVFSTDISVDVVPPGITKRDGLEWLAEHLSIDLDEIAYIGDADSDLDALEAVGVSFAPTNAQAVVRERVDHVTTGAVIEGTLEAYRYCRAQNENEQT